MSNSNRVKQTFQISYDTDETADHTIDAEKLGLAIVSTAKALKNADKVLNGEKSEISLDVKAHSEGSFVVEFVTYLSSVGINPLNILGLGGSVIAGAGSVMGALKLLGNRKIKMVQKTKNNTTVLTLSNDETLTLTNEVADLISSKTIRDSIDTIVKAPLEGVKDAKFIVKDENGNEVFTVNEDEVTNYKTLSQNIVDEITEREETKNVQFTNVNFDGATGWKVRFTDGENPAVRMKDDAFLERINKNKENFSKGDTFVVKLNIIKKHRHGTTPTYTREVIEVLRNRTEKGRQLTEE